MDLRARPHCAIGSLPPCPVDALLGPCLDALGRAGTLVLCAPPGAGKSTRVPLRLLDAPFLEGRKILLLEPRRIAAQALVRHMSALLGDVPGGLVGLRTRDATLTGPRTRCEILTEGVLVRMLLSQPDLPDVGCILFDEFHERSIAADAALALALESRQALRPDMRLCVMSATLEAEPVARLLGDAPILAGGESPHAVDVRYLPPPTGDFEDVAFWRHMADVCLHLLASESGSLLAFLPGMAEIRRTARLLEDRLPPDVDLHTLHSAIGPAAQDAALAPAGARRKLVLATSIAQTSLTIDGIRCVVDAGLSRQPRLDPATGLTRLVTRRVSLASAAQRAGRAGRNAPGVCGRLWHQQEERGMPAKDRPEMLDGDLSGMVLQLRAEGIADIASLPFLDPPPATHLDEARKTLEGLGALDSDGKVTDLGRDMAAIPADPRLAALCCRGKAMGLGTAACHLAAFLERETSPRGAHAGGDLVLQIAQAAQGRSNAPEIGRDQAQRLARHLGIRLEPWRDAWTDRLPALLALAWPGWVARRTTAAGGGRTPSQGKVWYRLRCGTSAHLPESDPLSRREFLAIAAIDVTGARIRRAMGLTLEDIETCFGPSIRMRDTVRLGPAGEIVARRERLLDELVLADVPLPAPDAETCRDLLCRHLQDLGADAFTLLPFDRTCRQWQARVSTMRDLEGDPWPDVTDDRLLARIPEWLAPALAGHTRVGDVDVGALRAGLASLLPGRLRHRLDQELPRELETPSGNRREIVYGETGGPWLAAKLQEFFGCRETPRIANGRIPLTLRLLSPAGRPLQVTGDLGHFWEHGYPGVRAEMRGRYPKHPWPEDPLTAPPTARPKTRGRHG
ncbi:MAG: ATP-dependent helicase HrpB [Desulfovibrio sp.]|nr:ATP-dependent helicase HrpB [Desulfovibrio sp.]